MEKNIKGITHMNKDITEFPNLKQIEQILWSKLQEIFSKALKSLLEGMDQQIAEERDKNHPFKPKGEKVLK
ncbi:UPF0236 family transposase-like protein [Caldibacillus debilis]|uniref:Uncharacterized protein n=1 Tax=Caldibacillus debilis TaxID=301148 RepID=A0A150L9J4_9BACI|nr:UPF0236 family protein [Caldibacillus debilis]KYD08372.1 hypothetical protein B4135_4083 [Caldibacillus debilis]